MAKVMKYLLAVLLFLTGNLYLGTHLVQSVEKFRLSLPFTFEVIQNKDASVFVTDMDGDGEKEVIGSVNHQAPKKLELWMIHASAGMKSYSPGCGVKVNIEYTLIDAYVDKKSGDCIFKFFDTSSGDFILKVMNLTTGKETQKQFGELTVKQPGDKHGYSVPHIVDIDNDGKQEILMLLFSFYIHKPRGVICFGQETGDLLWEYYSGTLFTQMEVEDLDNDGIKEIILSSNAISNGANMNGTSDAESFVVVLDHLGEERWKIQTGGWYTHAVSTICDLDDDGNYEIVTATECRRPGAGPYGKIFIFNGANGGHNESFKIDNACFSKPVVRRYGPNDVRIYVGDSAGVVRVFDKNLNKLIQEKVAATPVKLIDIAPYSESWPNIFAGTIDGIKVFDRNLEHLVSDFRFEKPCPGIMQISSSNFHPLLVNPGSRKERLAFLHADKMYLIREGKRSPVDIINGSIASGFLFNLFILLTFNALLIYFLYHSRQLRAQRIQEEAARKKEAAGFSEILCSIGHQVKNPLSTILWTAEKIQRGTAAIVETETAGNHRQWAGVLMDKVKELRQQTARLLKLVGNGK